MPTVRTLTTKFNFDADSGKLKAIDAQIQGVHRSLRSAAVAANQAQRAISGVVQTLGLAAVAYVAHTAVRKLTVDYAEQLDAAQNAADGMGISIERYQEMIHAAGLAGLKIEDVGKAFGGLIKKADEARKGSAEAGMTFARLGVKTTEAGGKLRSADDVLFDVADKFALMKPGADRSAKAIELFGESGAKMIPFLKDGSAGIRKLGMDARRLGLVMSAEAAADAQKFTAEMARAKGVFLGIRNAIAVQLIPKMTAGLKKFWEWATAGGSLKLRLDQLRQAAIYLSWALYALILIKVQAVMAGIATAVAAAARAVMALGWAGSMAAIKIKALWAALLLLPLILDDLYVFAIGGKSILGRFLDPTQAAAVRAVLLEIGRVLMGIWREIAPELASMWTIIKGLGPSLWAATKALFATIWEIAKPLVRLLIVILPYALKALTWLIKALTVTLAVAAQTITGILDLIVAFGQAIWSAGATIWEYIGGPLEAVYGVIKKIVLFVAKPFFEPLLTAARALKAIWEGILSLIYRAMGLENEMLAQGTTKEETNIIAGGMVASQIARDAEALVARIIAPPIGPSPFAPTMGMPGFGGYQPLPQSATLSLGGVAVTVVVPAGTDAAGVGESVKDTFGKLLREEYDQVYAMLGGKTR